MRSNRLPAAPPRISAKAQIGAFIQALARHSITETQITAAMESAIRSRVRHWRFGIVEDAERHAAVFRVNDIEQAGDDL